MSDALDALFEGRPATLDVPEVAALLGLTKQSVYNWLRDGVIPGYKLGSVWVILRDDLKETVRQGTNRPPTNDRVADGPEAREAGAGEGD